MTGSFGAALDGVAGLLNDIAGCISRIVEGLAHVGFTGFGYYFLRAIVANFYFGSGSRLSRSRLSEGSGSESEAG